MAKRKVVWTLGAKRQLQFVYEYWNEHNGSSTFSRKIHEQINNRLNTIVEFPQSGRLTDVKNTRVTAIGHYSLFYEIGNVEITITGFWDNRQDPSKLLDFLKS
jgi:hypothetical protein